MVYGAHYAPVAAPHRRPLHVGHLGTLPTTNPGFFITSDVVVRGLRVRPNLALVGMVARMVLMLFPEGGDGGAES